MRKHLQIGEMARLVGITTKTIRYYHEIDLLAEPERTASGYRLYTVQHLQRLQRIRRLRALGLPLESIRRILNEVPESSEGTLRAALHLLTEEITAQILELEERRAFLQDLLAREQLELPDQEASFVFPPDMKARLAPYFASLSAESLEWEQRVDAMLGSFNWPAEYQQRARNSLRHIADNPEHYRQLFVFEERFTALAHLPADAPEVEQLVEECLQSQEVAVFSQHIEHSGLGEKGPFSGAFTGLVASMVTPAQQRFFHLLRQKGSELAEKRSPAYPPHDTEKEQ